jgi:two-component system catabolic regulation response regulator CreB/two-component system response regulator ChvI
MVLEENGFKVDSFTDPLLALENFKEQDGMYDMVILDIKMPEMNGFELYRQIKKIDDKAKVCFLTAGEMYHGVYTDIFNSLDAKYFIRKPIDNEELVKRVNNMISS